MDRDIDDEEMHPNLITQIQLEEEAWGASLDKYDKQVAKLIENGGIAESKEVILIMKATIDTLSEHIERYMQLHLRGNNRKCQIFLKATFGKSDNIAFVLIKSILGELLQKDFKALTLGKYLVKVMFTMNNVAELKKTKPKLFSYIELNNKSKGEHKVKKAKRTMARRLITASNVDGDFAKVLGVTCIDLVLKSGCNLITQYKEHDTSINLKLSDDTKAMFLRSKAFFGSVLSSFYPLVYPPKPWTAIKGSGGYYTQKDITFIKCRSKRDLHMIEETQPDLSRLMDIVNKIQITPYKINDRVLTAIEHIIKHSLVNPHSKPTNPILYGEIPYMETMNLHELVVKSDYGKLNEESKFEEVEDKKKWLRALDDQENKIKRIESKRLGYKMAMEVATKFKKYEKIYFSYSLDFRSRLYPMQNFLNPQSSDNIKCMLEFAEGQILTPSGVKWLKIHGANCYGYDKRTYEGRIEGIDEKEEEIKKIRQDPIANIKLWYQADSPLLYLAFCFSYGDWLSDSRSYIKLPVQLDATCSGIQIYSGLLKDEVGALAVNVIGNEDRVNDIYQDVADKVEEYLATGQFPKKITYTTKDKEEHTTTTHREALSIRGKITRKLTKRNVMTQPYSVTARGMYEQVYELLSDHEDNNTVFWEGDKWIVATLIARLNDKAIAEIVKGAKIGQTFIKEVLKQALKEEDNAFWKTPIYDFPVLQRIKREKRQQLRTPLGQLVLYHPTDETHYIKMLNGIAPNYIHSMDATLLYRTIERCMDRGVSGFWLIHDSYGVLPNDVAILNEEVREAYIEIFKDNPLYHWVEQILPDGIGVVEKAMISTLDLNKVRESRYIFS